MAERSHDMCHLYSTGTMFGITLPVLKEYSVIKHPHLSFQTCNRQSTSCLYYNNVIFLQIGHDLLKDSNIQIKHNIQQNHFHYQYGKLLYFLKRYFRPVDKPPIKASCDVPRSF